MALLYVNETAASLDSAHVATGETIKEGEFIVQNAGGDVARFDPANDALPHGIVVHYAAGDSIAEHDEDYFANYDDLWTYTEGDRLYYQPLASVDQIQPPTLSDNGTDPEPSIAEGNIVGIVTINGETEVVQSGYTDDAGTVYSESGTGDFVAIGRLNKYPQEWRITSQFDQRAPIRLDSDLFTTSG